MRVLSFLLPLFLMSHLGVAAPLVDDSSLNTPSQDMILNGLHSLALRSPNKAHDVMAHLESWAPTCTPLSGQLIRVIKDTTAQCVLTGSSSA